MSQFHESQSTYFERVVSPVTPELAAIVEVERWTGEALHRPDVDRTEGSFRKGVTMLHTSAQGFRVGKDGDHFGERHDLGIGRLTFKVVTQDSQGSLLAVELTHHTAGGPPRHVHHEQDEWFYVLEGQYLVEVGGEQFWLEPGDSAFGPREISHTWAFLGGRQGRMMFAVTPAGRLEAFLRELSRMGAMAPQDPAFWPPYGMELVGPPLDLGPGETG